MRRLAAGLFTSGRRAFPAQWRVTAVASNDFAAWLRREFAARALTARLITVELTARFIIVALTARLVTAAWPTLLRAIFGPGLRPNRRLGAWA